MKVGHVKELFRHPVKSFTGEAVQKAKVMPYGLYGDRSHAFKDETRDHAFLTITQAPQLVLYQARFVGEEALNRFPKVEIMTPDQRVLKWGDEELTREMEQLSNRVLSPIQYEPTNVPLGAIEEEHLLLVTDASLQEIQKIWGDKIDSRRFRPNLLIALKDNIPFIEETWTGKRLKIGTEVELEIKRPCERCMIITVNPDTAFRHSSLLKAVVDKRNNHFGVYASVMKTGDIKIGDTISIH
ncbi:MOSC domain-containing protein [Halalkalibacterium ligniniphilum]|uniref:MOSC domain-containing protein n=1 Tax=Halalkalibacterium ligniniphilum TaxID=1134413 RepID=UPI00034DF224|nr:MOSC domain-containing protein [Halalkalibacterium ligniniphilum]